MGESAPLPHRTRRFQYRSRSSEMEVPRLSIDSWALLRAASGALAQIQTRPRAETAVKYSSGVAAAVLALKYAKSLRSACVVGLIAGIFAHSLYADVLRKRPPMLEPSSTTGEGQLELQAEQIVDMNGEQVGGEQPVPETGA